MTHADTPAVSPAMQQAIESYASALVNAPGSDAHINALHYLRRLIATLEDACALDVLSVNALVEWLDGPDGNGRSDDAIIKFADASGRAIAHVNAAWMKRFLTVTTGVDLSEGAAHRVPSLPEGPRHE